ncbi:MAG TPA: SIS domain-containing protein [Acidimicrobiales bacterium]|nr:SIS domain-containing protein [Acidimicrobiales bacterium]
MDVGESLQKRSTEVFDALARRCPELEGCIGSLAVAADLVCRCFRAGGRLYLCGNGGSHADCLHIAAELVKSYGGPRPLQVGRREALLAAGMADSERLASSLQAGLPAIVLGANGAVAFAIANDLDAELVFAQELEAFGRAGDVLLALSTSGESRNVVLAAEVACSLSIDVVAFAGAGAAASTLGTLARVVVAAPASATNEVQELHSRLYHGLCGAVEADLFG